MADMIRKPAIRCQICFNNATVVDDAIRFVSSNQSRMTSASSSNDDREESNEPDYNEDKDQLEEEQEEQTGEITATTNQVF